MNRKFSQQGSAHTVVVVCLVLALITALGWIFYQNFIAKEPAKKDTELLVVKKDDDTKPQTTSDPSEGGKYLVVKEWGLRFKLPQGLKDVRYYIHGDKVAFFGKPTDSTVEYRNNYNRIESNSFPYATGVLERSKDATRQVMDTQREGKKLGDYYYYTAWSFSSLATGAGVTGVFYDQACDKSSTSPRCATFEKAESKAFELINSENGLLRSIEEV